MTNNDFEKLLRHCLVEFADQTPSEDQVRETVDWLRERYRMTDDEYQMFLRTLFEQLQMHMDTGVAVVGKGTKPWLDARRADIDFFYWNRYRTYLTANKGWNGHVVSAIGRVADEVLDLLGNPADKGKWQRRGLIMGDVQSGKTANYTSLCNKAMDAGYRVIVVLTGTQENLRKQTQERLDIELVGLNSESFLDKVGRQMTIGVGKVDPRHYVATFTSVANDFDQKLLNTLNLRITTCSEPVLFVVKKQKQRLKYLHDWLKRYNARGDGLIDEPILLIDDEADNASVNTKSEDNPTAINQGIRQLLSLFTRATYVGVTATPYANIFIDPESDHEMLKNDLFPSDFIYSLSPPSNYIGNNAYFGENATHEDMLCKIDDAETVIPIKHKKDYSLETLPESLYEALSYFLLTNVVRNIRGQKSQHRSMLINISRFTNIHEHIRDYVQTWLDNVRSDVQNYGGFDQEKACRIPSIKRLRKVWDEYDFEEKCPVPWEAIQKQYLHEAISPIKLVVVNQRTGAKSLDYTSYKEEGMRVIAIGGISLSRGLTLEGLCVSYFYRNSQAYDTLLQMGRWFGYRPGYEDLCRIWMSDESRECYTHITLASIELRSEIEEMKMYGLTPEDYGLMVRAHPDNVETIVGKMLVTARNKMQAATELIHTISVSGKLIETPRFPNKEPILVHNYKSVMSFTEGLSKFERMKDEQIYSGDHPVWLNVPGVEVAALVREFMTDPMYLKFQADSLADFIEKMPHLQLWDVAIPEGERGKEKEQFSISGIGNIRLEGRPVDSGRMGTSLRINGHHSRVGSRPCTRYGLEETKVKKIEKDKKEKDNKQTSDKSFLVLGRKPLLLLHFINMNTNEDIAASEMKKKLQLQGVKCLVAIGLGFPLVVGEVGNQRIRYIMNKVKEKELLEAYMEVEDADD